jgi:hypothetical protein
MATKLKIVKTYPARDRFLDRIVKGIHLRERMKGKANQKVLKERMGRRWFGLELPDDKTPVWQATRREQFFVEIFIEYKEIYAAVVRLELASRFLRELQPHRATADVIGYHIEKTFEETYIVKVRTVRFLTRLERRLRRHRQPDLANMAIKIREAMEKSFEGIVQTRGTHVHQDRFEDTDVDRLSSLDFLVKAGAMKALESIRRNAARVALTKWRRLSSSNIEAINTLLDQMLGQVESMIFDTLAPKEQGTAANRKGAAVYELGSMRKEPNH